MFEQKKIISLTIDDLCKAAEIKKAVDVARSVKGVASIKHDMRVEGR